MKRLLLGKDQESGMTGFEIMADHFADAAEDRSGIDIAVQQCVLKAGGLKHDTVHAVSLKALEGRKKFIAVISGYYKQLPDDSPF